MVSLSSGMTIGTKFDTSALAVSEDMERLLNRVQEIRQVADYRGDSVELSDAQEMIEQAETFVAAMRLEFIRDA